MLHRLETQAGTYIKEFVHGDFGRTRPSLADLLGVENGEVDILELDVEKVDQEWPVKVKNYCLLYCFYLQMEKTVSFR